MHVQSRDFQRKYFLSLTLGVDTGFRELAIEMQILFLEKAVGTLLHIFERSILKEEWSLRSVGTSAWDLMTLWLSHNEVGELNQHG